MDCASRRPCHPWLLLTRRLAVGLSVTASLSLGAGGCNTFSPLPEYPNVPPTAQVATAAPPAAAVVPVPHTTTAPAVAAPPAPALAPPKELYITYDTIFHLAEQHNARVGVAREKLNESLISQEQRACAWLPNTYAGIAYYRHEGGIQNENGTLTHSSTQALMPALQLQSELDFREAVFRQIDNERKVWQQRAELSQVNSEVLLDAANTYVDLLTARRGQAVVRALQRDENRLLQRAEKLAKVEVSARSLVLAVQSSLRNREYNLSKLEQQARSASAKLVYLLGLPPGTTLVPADAVLAPVELVDASASPAALVNQAMTTGPGVRELEGVLSTIQNSIDAGENHRYLPNVLLNVSEGPFGAGVGSSLTWDNRLDIGVQVRWNLSQFLEADRSRRLARSRQEQVALTLDDTRGKLAAGVEDARETILASRQQIELAQSQLQSASESYRQINRRVEEGVEGTNPADLLTSLRVVEQAHFNHLSSIREHNKAQVRLLLFLGKPGPVKVLPPAAAAPHPHHRSH